MTNLWRVQLIVLLSLFATRQVALGKEPEQGSMGDIETLLAGHYDNSAQWARPATGVPAGSGAVPPVTVTIEPTRLPNWELWRVHMEVDPEVARAAGSATSLEAVWAMKLTTAQDRSLRLIPYTSRAGIEMESVTAAAFDESQWLSLEACMLLGDFGKQHVFAQVAGDEMCVAAAMGIGGKRAFLPSLVERQADWLHVQITYLGSPLLIEARRVP
jgi:hypothetical protein